MKQDFLNYLKTTFSLSDKEMLDFEKYSSMPLKKTLRVNTNKISIEDFKKLAKIRNWELEKTNLWENLFYIDREDTSLALWNTPEHISGYFYIQELSASSPPFYLSKDKIDKSEYLILDMSSSPWWKTSSLSEYFPNSIIIANELDKSRLKWLFSNIDRMSCLNTFVTNYDWRFFKNLWEIFDKILLDAPCSWEWTAFKTKDSLKYWNIKNIKRIAKLQFWLLESAIKCLKVDWELIYSTCTLNKIENEEVIEKAIKKYGDYIEIEKIDDENTFKRSWPHKEKAWWFFVAKFKKKKSFDDMFYKNNLEVKKQWFEKLTKNETEFILDYIKNNFSLDFKKYNFYKYLGEVYITKKSIKDLHEKMFFYQIWVKIWKIEKNVFSAYNNLWIIESFDKNAINLEYDSIKKLFSGENIETDLSEWFYQIKDKDKFYWLVRVKNNMFSIVS